MQLPALYTPRVRQGKVPVAGHAQLPAWVPNEEGIKEVSLGIIDTRTLCVLQFFTQLQVLYKHHTSMHPPNTPTRLPLPN